MHHLTTIIVLFACVGLSSAVTFKCQKEPKTIAGERGYLQIDRSSDATVDQKSLLCGFDLKSQYLVIRTDNLILRADENLKVDLDDVGQKPIEIVGPIESGYLYFANNVAKLTFDLKVLDGTTMILEFFLSNSIPLSIDRKRDLVIQSYGATEYTIAATSTTGKAHLEVVGTGDKFGHHLIDEKSTQIKVVGLTNTTAIITAKASPIRADCSNTITDASEASHEIAGPEAATIKEPYKCVNIFTTTMKDQAHYDVDFTNFLDVVDNADELTIDDGYQPLKIGRYNAKDYYQRRPVVSFKGQNLAVLYDSPQVVQPRAVFKLSVDARSIGGVVDSYQPLKLPNSGLVRYTLKPQSNDAVSGLEIAGNLAGVAMKISNKQNQVLVLKGDMYLPPTIALDRSGEEVNVEFNITKVAATISYKQVDNCSGTIFGSSGAISVNGKSKTCYWLVGSKSTISVNYNDLVPDGCLEFYQLDRKQPIFSKCNLGPGELLPKLVAAPSYIKFKLPSKDGALDISISKPVESQTVTVSTGQQTKITSVGYPNSYSWSSDGDKYSLGAINKSMILSVADLDIRAGEKFLVNDIEVNNQNLLSLGDVDISNKESSVTIQRSGDIKDFDFHRGYSIVITTFQSIVTADPKKTSIKTPKNQTSLLIKISTTEPKRLSYNISSPASSEYSMSLYDARSILGRQVYEDEKQRGTTTSNVLFISLVATKEKATLPEINIDYSTIECNKTSDHVCDSSTRCVPASKLCKGRAYCIDGTDLKIPCASGPAPQPQIIDRGLSGMTVFFLSMFMFTIGIIAAIYGPDLYKNLDGRFRSGQYTTFTSTE